MSEHGVVKGFEQPFTIKNQNTQLNKKKRPLRVTPIMDKKKNVHTVFQVYIQTNTMEIDIRKHPKAVFEHGANSATDVRIVRWEMSVAPVAPSVAPHEV